MNFTTILATIACLYFCCTLLISVYFEHDKKWKNLDLKFEHHFAYIFFYVILISIVILRVLFQMIGIDYNEQWQVMLMTASSGLGVLGAAKFFQNITNGLRDPNVYGFIVLAVFGIASFINTFHFMISPLK